MSASRPDKVCVGMIAGVHGVRGLVKVKPFTADPEGVTAYGPVTDDRDRPIRLDLQSMLKGQWLARIDGIGDRTAAQALTGTRLYVDRSRLPEPEEEEYYHADLLGLMAVTPDGKALGRVGAVHDFGAGDVLEIVPDAATAEAGADTMLVPFTRAAVPSVDLAAGRVVVDVPDEVVAGPEAASGAPAAGRAR
ncbi:MAG: ribosome maturation factor RimM [Inquilinaceae bacterium]